MTMLKDLFDAVVGFVRKGDTLVVHENQQIPRARFFVIGGVVTEKKLPDPLERHAASDVASFARMLASKDRKPLFVAVGEDKASAPLVDGREWIELRLEQSGAWGALKAKANASDGRKPTPLTPAAAVEFVAYEIKANGKDVDDFVSTLRHLTFVSTETRSSVVQPQRQSISREIAGETKGKDKDTALPEFVSFLLRPFATLGLDAIEVEVVVAVSYEGGNVTMRVVGDGIREAFLLALERARGLIDDAVQAEGRTDLPVVRGAATYFPS